MSIVRETMARLGGSVGYLPASLRGSIFYVDVPRWNAEVILGDPSERSVDAA